MDIVTEVVPLHGTSWLFAIDPGNQGREENWFASPRPEAQALRVPGVMQELHPDYHGVAWYWRDFTPPANAHVDGRYLLRFGAVDYLAEVWVNGLRLGLHEGAGDPFEFDATIAIKPNARNLLAVRILNPTIQAIDGIRLMDVAIGRRENGVPNDNACNTGGIIDAVELLVSPALRVESMHVIPDWKTGGLRVRTNVRNASGRPMRVAQVHVTVAPATSGESVAAGRCEQDFAPGDTLVETQVHVLHHRLWELDDPYLYRVTVGVRAAGSPSVDERSVRCGFRDFCFADGFFRLNGRRIRLHGSLYVMLHYPVSMSVPHDDELVRRDVLNLKMMGFNSVRISCGAALPARQLDFFDELGLLVCEEHFGADARDQTKHMAETPQLEARWDNSIAGVIRRDRNHPSVVMWSLLNEVHDGRLFRHVAQSLVAIRDLDESRIVLLNSGRFDGDPQIGSWSSQGSWVWEKSELRDVHAYPTFPHSAEAIRDMRGLVPFSPTETQVKAGDMRPMLLSEYGVCGAEDYLRLLRHFEQLGQSDAGDAKVYRAKLEAFLIAWRKWHLEQCWARPEDYFRDSQQNQARLVRDDFNAWTANPMLIGSFSSTQINDAWFHGCGVTTYFRELKPGMADVYAEIGAKVRWCLFVEPVNVYRRTRVRFEAVLCNLDVLKPGVYPVSVQIVDPQMRCLYDGHFTVEIPQVNQRPEPPFARTVFSRDVVVDGPSGQYRFLASFENGAAAAGGDVEFYVSDPAEMPMISAEVVLWGEDDELAQWLSGHGIRWRRLAAADPNVRHVILASGELPAPGGTPVFAELAGQIAMGATVVFLTHATLIDRATSAVKLPCPLRWAPFPVAERPSLDTTPMWYFRADHWAKDHPVFAGLPAGGILNYQYYREIIGGYVIAGLADVDQAVCGAIQASGHDFRSDLLLSVHRFGAGRFILNTLNIRKNLGQVPVAERLLRNLLIYAASDCGKPLVALPADFHEQLRTFGYE